MREIPYTSKLACAEDKQPLALDYYILATDSEPEHYGVKIVEKNSGAQVLAFHLTVCTDRIYELVDKLVQNSVTPTGLEDVLAKWL